MMSVVGHLDKWNLAPGLYSEAFVQNAMMSVVGHLYKWNLAPGLNSCLLYTSDAADE